MGSGDVVFRPGGRIAGGEYRWDIGTAGSTTMLTLALLPVAIFADLPTTFLVSGGVYQDFAPSPDHMRHVLLPMLGKMGIEASLEILRPGYVPGGNGLVRVTVKPVAGPPRPLSLPEQGMLKAVRGQALSSHLKEQRVSERMAAECRIVLSGRGIDASIDITYDESASQAGASLAIQAETDAGCRLGADQTGKRGRSSERIGRHVAESLLEDLGSGATVDRYLADQLVVYGALAAGVTEYVIPVLTDHVDANLWLIEKIGARARPDGKQLRIEGVALVGSGGGGEPATLAPGVEAAEPDLGFD